jgi:hypothetical protein
MGGTKEKMDEIGGKFKHTPGKYQTPCTGKWGFKNFDITHDKHMES